MDDGSQEPTQDDMIVKRRRKTNVVNSVSDETAPSIHMLNDECLDLILSPFSTVEHFKLALVCRRWFNVCRTKISLLTSLSCRSLAQSLSVISLNCGSLTFLAMRLDLRDRAASEAILKAISKYCPNLLGLDLGRTAMDRQLSEQLSQNFPKKLKFLRLVMDEEEGEECLDKILMKAESLEKLSLSSVRNTRRSHNARTAVTELDGSSIAIHLIHNKMKYFSFEGFGSQLKKTVIEIILNNYRLSLEHLDIARSGTQLLDVSTNPSKIFPNMKRFYAFGTARSEEELIMADSQMLIIMDLQKLTKFLRLMPNLTLLDLTSNCNLQSYALFFKHVAESCPLLESLNLSGCNLLPQNLVYLKNFKFLKKLTLGGLDSCRRGRTQFDMFDDDFVCFDFNLFAENIVGGLRSLNYLNIDSNPFLSDDDVYLIIRNLHDNTNVVVDIEDLGYLSDNLSMTFIEKCHSINRSSIVEIVCKNLDNKNNLNLPQFMRIKSLQEEEKHDITIGFNDWMYDMRFR